MSEERRWTPMDEETRFIPLAESPDMDYGILGESVERVFEITEDINPAGHERFTTISTEDGEVELTPDNHTTSRTAKVGEFLVHLKEEAADHKKGLAAATGGILVGGLALKIAAKAMNVRKRPS